MARMRRLIELLLYAVLFVGCNPSQSRNEKAASDASQPVQGDSVIVRFEADPDILNPLMSVTQVGHYAMWGINNSQVYEFLMAYSPKTWGLTEPLLAETAPAISNDHLSYTFQIRNGITWHDGRPFTAEDVLFTFKAAACPFADTVSVRSFLTDIADIQLEGRTLRFVMTRPNSYNVSNIANILAIIPKHVFDPDGLLDAFSYKDMVGSKGKTDPKIKKFANQFNTNAANRAPVGTGPYKFERWESGRELVLRRNDTYWGKKPFLDKIVYRIITDYTAALAALKAGDIDLQPRLLPLQYQEQTGGSAFDEQFTKAKYSIPAEYWLLWNNEVPFFKDKRVRQAMTMLVDRQKIIDNIRLGLASIGVSPFDPQARDFNPNIKPLPYDPKRAAELLDEAGWKDRDGDGIRDKDGVRFKFEFIASSSSTIWKQLSPVLTDAFRKAGIETTERIVEFNLQTKNLKEHRFDASALGVSYDLIQDQYQMWHTSSASGGTNYMNFKNPEADRLLEAARLEFNDEKRKALYWRWQEIIQDEQPVTFLYYQQDPAAYSKRFQNVQWLPLRPGYDLNSWWVPVSQQKYKNGTAR
jgi:peptide/nickel transport system substrate-binding protein